jgi:feruloyl esterase
MVRLKTALVGTAAILTTAAWSPANAAVNCPDLVNLKIAASEIGLPSGGATITSAQTATVPADPVNPGATRDYCKVLGEVLPVDPNAPPVSFEVNLPADWNGKAVQYGGGGSNGVLITGLLPLPIPATTTKSFLTRGPSR